MVNQSLDMRGNYPMVNQSLDMRGNYPMVNQYLDMRGKLFNGKSVPRHEGGIIYRVIRVKSQLREYFTHTIIMFRGLLPTVKIIVL